MRVKRHGANPLTSKVMPGIVMDGTMPTFYKIPIIPELVGAVESGEHLWSTPNRRQQRIPEVPGRDPRKVLDNCCTIFSRFEALRQSL
jgi:hypothetical protein